MALDVSGFLIANVPPKPQHLVGARQLDELQAAHVPQEPNRCVAHPRHAK
jgi:hypothetical protein